LAAIVAVSFYFQKVGRQAEKKMLILGTQGLFLT
jgi:hypothetical protein